MKASNGNSVYNDMNLKETEHFDMEIKVEKNIFFYTMTKDQQIEILRVFGETGYVSIPDKIENHPVKKISAYCFSKNRRITGNQKISDSQGIAVNQKISDSQGIVVNQKISDSQEIAGNQKISNSQGIAGNQKILESQRTLDNQGISDNQSTPENKISIIGIEKPVRQGSDRVELGKYMFQTVEQCVGESDEQSRIFLKQENVSEEIALLYMEEKIQEEFGLFEIAGNTLIEAEFPDSVTEFGNCVFYNCRKLECLTLGKQIEILGSDAFLNCSKLHRLYLKCPPQEKTSLKQLLIQISWNIEVSFEKEDGGQVSLLYPEYYESYDEIGPAHIFELNLTGEGFRARQCFLDGVVAFRMYDAIFPQACIEETAQVLCRMALNRILYPYDLTDTNRRQYEDYLKTEVVSVMQMLLKERKLTSIEILIQKKLFSEEIVSEGIKMASEMEWPEAVVSLLKWKREYFVKEVKNKYDFEEF